jgi:hypothetical protein
LGCFFFLSLQRERTTPSSPAPPALRVLVVIPNPPPLSLFSFATELKGIWDQKNSKRELNKKKNHQNRNERSQTENEGGRSPPSSPHK